MEEELAVRLDYDPQASTISIEHNGCALPEARLRGSLGAALGIGPEAMNEVADEVVVASRCSDGPIQRKWPAHTPTRHTMP